MKMKLMYFHDFGPLDHQDPLDHLGILMDRLDLLDHLDLKVRKDTKEKKARLGSLDIRENQAIEERRDIQDHMGPKDP